MPEPRLLSEAIAERKQSVQSLKAVESPTKSRLQIFDAIDAFEHKMAQLIGAVSLYRPAAALAKELLAVDTRLSAAVDELRTYQSNKEVIAQLKAVSDALDAQIDAVLSNLADARARLLAVPDDDMSVTPTPSGDLLDYATKIAKFSTAPPGFVPPETWAPRVPTPKPADASEATAEETAKETVKTVYALDSSSVPAKLPWPAEDEMRRGLLAHYNRLHGGGDGVVATEMAVVVPGETAGGEPVPENVPPRRARRRRQKEHNDESDDDSGDESSGSDYADAQESKAQHGAASEQRPEREILTQAALLDLDLFDPDDD